MYPSRIFILFSVLPLLYTCRPGTMPVNHVTIHIGTYLGGAERNYYGNRGPDALDTLWRHYLGEGISPAYGNPQKLWKGAGWTGQPLIVEENGELFLIQGAFDYHLKKIRASDGKLVWQYQFDDIIKGTGTIWENPEPDSAGNAFFILQGSRRGVDKSIESELCPSFRAVSLSDGRETWRMNVTRTPSYSRDVDGSALALKDTAYLALENGLFTIFSPDPKKIHLREGIMQPQIFRQIPFYQPEDTLLHGGNIESESSPCLLNGRIFTTSGSGRVYGYNISRGTVDWVYDIGADLNGSPVVTDDSCLLIAVEKQYIPGPGGVFKLDPSLPPEHAVVWFFPVGDTSWFHWEGGIVGSVALNDRYVAPGNTHLATFIGVDGKLYVVDHHSIDSTKKVIGPDNSTRWPSPRLVYSENTGGTISTPIITENRLIAPLDNGLRLYAYNEDLEFSLLDSIPGIQIDATPVVWDSRLYVASLDGYLYCFGDRK